MKTKLSTVFRPVADANTLLDLNEKAWIERYNTLVLARIPEVGEALAKHLESLYPPADMEFLKRYKCTATVESANVRVRAPGSDRWEESIGVILGRKVMVASSYMGLYCGGPRYSEMPDRGLTAKSKAEVIAGEHGGWEKFCADQDESDRRTVPRELESFFFEIVAERTLYKRDYKQIHDWPKQHKAETGRYPTWRELAERFPVPGALILEGIGK